MKKDTSLVTQKNAHLVFMAPGFILFGIFGLYPIIASFIYSFQNKVGNKPVTFIGFDNYIKAFSDKLFMGSMLNTLVIFIMHAPLMIIAATVLAHILNQKSIRYRHIFKTAFFLPNVANAVAYTLLFKILFANDGIFNLILERLFGMAQIPWLTDPTLAKAVISIMIIWRWTGYNMVILLAAMQNIGLELYEAASIDGASKNQQFFHITVPLLKNAIAFTSIMTVSGSLNLFAETQLLMAGGPRFGTYTPSLAIYTVAFKQFNFGYASAMSYIISILTIIIALVQFNLGKEKN